MSGRLQQRIKLHKALGGDIEWPASTRDYYCRIINPDGTGQICKDQTELAKWLIDPWTSLDDCAACDAWIRENGDEDNGRECQLEITREYTNYGWCWSVWYDKQALGDDLAATWADAIYSVVVSDE